MKKLGAVSLYVVIFGVLTSVSSGASATSSDQNYCAILASADLKLSHNDVQANRINIREFARERGLPAFEVELSNGFTPVILLNKKTLPHWAHLLENSFGIAQALNPGTDADHGYARLPGGVSANGYFQAPGTLNQPEAWTPAILMDLYRPAEAGKNAAAGTGYRFKRLDSYFKLRDHESKVYVDLAYAISKEDQRRVWLYHAAKRIALVRLQYAFDQANNHWIVQQRRVLQQDLPESACMLNGGFEHCNNSRLAGNGHLHVREMRQRAHWLFNKPVNEVFNTDEGRQFLNQAKDDLLYRDWRDRNAYDPNFLSTEHFVGLLSRHLHSHLSWDQKVDAISYFLAINIFEEAIQIRNSYEIKEARQNQYGNPNISAILIHSEYPESVGNFYDANARFYGAASGNGFDSNHFRNRKIHEHGSPRWKEFLP